MSEPIRIRVLGPLSVTRGDEPLVLGGRQQRAVFARLVVAFGSAVSVARIADALWGERVPPGHVQTIQAYVSHLRAVLGADRDLLRTADGGYRLVVDDGTVDAQEFHRLVRLGQDQLDGGNAAVAGDTLRAALALWRGEVLEDLCDYAFAADYAGPVEELRVTAMESLVEARLALGDHRRLVPELDEMVARHPLRERLHCQRMLALYRSGRQAEALAAFQQVRRLLDDELGVAPGPELQRMQERILAHDPSLEAQGQSARQDAAARMSGESSPARSPAPRRRVLALSAVAVVVTAAVAGYAVDRGVSRTLVSLAANAVGSVTADGTLRHAIRVGANPTALAAGAGSLWAVSEAEAKVYRIDAGSDRVVQTIGVGQSPMGLTVTGKDVWVVNSTAGTVSRINTDVNSVVDTVRVGTLPRAIASGASGVWVANRGDDTVQRLDPTTGRAGPPIAVGGSPSALAVADGAVYVANEQDRTVLQVDPDTGQPVGGPIPVGTSPRALVLDGDDLWVANSAEQTVSRIDRRTRRETARVTVGDGPASLAMVGGSLWVANEDDGTVSIVDPARNTVTHRYPVGVLPRGLAAGDDAAWVVGGPAADPGHHGGTLRRVGRDIPGMQLIGIDPTSMFKHQTTWNALRLVYDGLVAYEHTGGPNSFTLVPDLATSIPVPTDGGRTYSFALRPGIRYSDGTPVRASDIRRGVLRALTIEPGQARDSRIIGSKECMSRPASCDLSAGVVVDDARSTVVFHLTEPNPVFLHQLAYFGQATVPSAPDAETSTPLPGTGPYLIADYAQGKSFALARNPYFRVWSHAAQPDGFPDRIEYSRVPALDDGVAAIDVGSADVVPVNSGVAPEVSDDLARRHPASYLTSPLPEVQLYLLNTSTAPFDDLRIRRAVNLAVDRRKVVSLLGGPTRADPTCQLIPVNILGHRPYCPYSQLPDQGPDAGPDLARAKALVGQSAMRGQEVVVHDFATGRALSTYLVSVLRDLGFRARLASPWTAYEQYEGFLRDPRSSWQVIGSPGWIADWPEPSNVYLNLFRCHEHVGLANQSLYCNPRLDADAARALSLEESDPSSARRLWADIDRRLTDDAPALFLYASRRGAFVSERVGNLQLDAQGSPLLSQMWVR